MYPLVLVPFCMWLMVVLSLSTSQMLSCGRKKKSSKSAHRAEIAQHRARTQKPPPPARSPLPSKLTPPSAEQATKQEASPEPGHYGVDDSNEEAERKRLIDSGLKVAANNREYDTINEDLISNFSESDRDTQGTTRTNNKKDGDGGGDSQKSDPTMPISKKTSNKNTKTQTETNTKTQTDATNEEQKTDTTTQNTSASTSREEEKPAPAPTQKSAAKVSAEKTQPSRSRSITESQSTEDNIKRTANNH